MVGHERGFTLIELLVTISILGILAATSLMSVNTLRQTAYDAASEHLIHDAFTSLEAGQSSADSLTAGFYWAWADGSGRLMGTDVSTFLPGLQVKSKERLWVSYNGWCESAASAGWCAPGARCCVLNMIQAYHCKADRVTSIARWNNGEETRFEWRNFMRC